MATPDHHDSGALRAILDGRRRGLGVAAAFHLADRGGAALQALARAPASEVARRLGASPRELAELEEAAWRAFLARVLGQLADELTAASQSAAALAAAPEPRLAYFATFRTGDERRRGLQQLSLPVTADDGAVAAALRRVAGELASLRRRLVSAFLDADHARELVRGHPRATRELRIALGVKPGSLLEGVLDARLGRVAA